MMMSVDVEGEYRRSVDALLRFATALVGPADALDVVSEVVTATVGAGRLAEVDDVRAYWFRAVANRSASWHRSTQRRRQRERRAASGGDPGAALGADDARALLAPLTAQQRAVVYLAYWHDWDIARIASTLHVSDGTVRKQLARARAHLREVMHDERR